MEQTFCNACGEVFKSTFYKNVFNSLLAVCIQYRSFQQMEAYSEVFKKTSYNDVSNTIVKGASTTVYFGE